MQAQEAYERSLKQREAEQREKRKKEEEEEEEQAAREDGLVDVDVEGDWDGFDNDGTKITTETKPGPPGSGPGSTRGQGKEEL